jgi:hypothetical protein
VTPAAIGNSFDDRHGRSIAISSASDVARMFTGSSATILSRGFIREADFLFIVFQKCSSTTCDRQILVSSSIAAFITNL